VSAHVLRSVRDELLSVRLRLSVLGASAASLVRPGPRALPLAQLDAAPRGLLAGTLLAAARAPAAAAAL